MSLSVWKFPLPIQDTVEVEMPAGAEILTVQRQQSDTILSMWALVNPDAVRVRRRFHIRGTGHEIHGDPGFYLATVQTSLGALVWHVFEDQFMGEPIP